MKRSIIFIAALAVFGHLHGQSVGRSATIDVKNNDDFSGFEMLDSAVLKARVIMTGENHLYVKFNSKMELKMLRYLNKKLGLRNFVIELGAARAHFLNRYIHDEKDSMAGKFLRATTSPRYMDLFNRLRKFNSTLEESQKINIYGIDVERFNDLPLMRLCELLPFENVPAEIRVGVEAVKSTADYMLASGLKEYERARDESSTGSSSYSYEEAPFYVTPTITEFIRYYDSLKPTFVAWLGSKFAEVDRAVNWLREFKQWNDYDNTTFQYIWREENIYRNLSALVKNNPGERFYGQFGRCHVAYDEQNGECGWYGYHSVINKMRTRYFGHYDSVLTIGLFYTGGSDHSYYSDREDDKAIQSEIDELVENTKSRTVKLYHLADKDASLPELAKKFTFAVVNKSADEEDEDSVTSEVISWEDKEAVTIAPRQYFGYGYAFTNISMNLLNEHAKLNGYMADLGSLGMHSFSYGRAGKRLDHGFTFSFAPKTDMHHTDSGLVQYAANQMRYRIAYQLKRTKHFELSLGADMGYGRQKINFSDEGTSFLATRKDKDFVNPALFAGPSAQAVFKFARYFFVSVQGTQLFDLSANQWIYRGSTQKYGEAGKVSPGYSGLYFTASFGFFVDVPDYSSGY